MRKERLRERIEKSGHNSTTIAEVLGVSDRQVRRWVSGENDPSSEMTAALAKVLNTSSDYLLGLSDDPSPHIKLDNMTEDERAVLAAMRRGDNMAAMKILVNH